MTAAVAEGTEIPGWEVAKIWLRHLTSLVLPALTLAFLATGSYGKPQPKQNGAPIRLITPWKFGFKSINFPISFCDFCD